MQEQAHIRDVHCSFFDTGLCQDPGIRARYYIPREDPLCFSLSDRNCFHECVISLYMIIFFKTFPNVNENTHTDLVSCHFTISKRASILPVAYLQYLPVYFPLYQPFSPLLETESQCSPIRVFSVLCLVFYCHLPRVLHSLLISSH